MVYSKTRLRDNGRYYSNQKEASFQFETYVTSILPVKHWILPCDSYMYTLIID